MRDRHAGIGRTPLASVDIEREIRMQLYIGNKNYSSWSLRPWLAMRQAGIDFEEIKLRLSFEADSPFKHALARVAPSGKVPVLVDEGFAVWDTLAIAEYVAEKFPGLALWPVDPLLRARARSMCAEMHSGFTSLRQHCPMNIEAELPEVGPRLLHEQPGVAADLQRLVEMWQQALAPAGGPLAGRPRSEGAFLFGRFGIVDAYFAPVCARIRTYALPVPSDVAAYVDAVHAVPAMRAWCDEARGEHDFIADDEPYRSR